MQEIQLKNEELIQFEALKNQAETTAKNCSLLTVSDSTSLAIATQNLSKAKELIRNIEKIRKAVKDPYLKAGQQIDKLAENLSSPIEIAVKQGEKAILEYNKTEEEKARKEQQRIQNIKDDIQKYSKETIDVINKVLTVGALDDIYYTNIKNFPGEERWFEFNDEAQKMRVMLRDACKQKHIELTTPKEADETVQEAIQETITAQLEVFGAEEIKEAEFNTTSNIKDKWIFEVVDKSKLSLAWIMPDEKAIKAFIKEFSNEFKDGCVIDGVKFTIEKQLKIR